MKNFILLCLFISFPIFSQDEGTKTQIEKEMDEVDFSEIKDVLRKDKLKDQALQKLQKVKKIEEKRKKIWEQQHRYPQKQDFWTFMSELWLVKNAHVLKWDYEKPNYGIGVTFKKLLQKIGHKNVKVRILLCNTDYISHYALPANPNEYIFILSVPFIRTMDLSKLEISLLLLEDFYRSKHEYFMSNINTVEMEKLYGTVFTSKTFAEKIIPSLLTEYENQIHQKGFNFSQQFKLTQTMSQVLRDDLNLWNSYYLLNKKRDQLVKSNSGFKNYTKLYPSPEMQIKWLTPK